MGDEPLEPLEIEGSVNEKATFNHEEVRGPNSFGAGMAFEGNIK